MKRFLGNFKKVVDICTSFMYIKQVAGKNRRRTWDLSSAGRASALQAGGHRFEPCRSHFVNEILHKVDMFQTITYGEIAQLARAHGSYPWCRGFESPSRYYLKVSETSKIQGFRFFCVRKKYLKYDYF